MLPTLLIVEDERATREGLRSALEEEFEVYTAAGKAEALAILKSERIHLLLTDLRLGGDSGMDILEAALALPEPPVSIMMTAYGSVDTAVEAMRRGAWHFVTKPLNLDEVEMLLKRALRGLCRLTPMHPAHLATVRIHGDLGDDGMAKAARTRRILNVAGGPAVQHPGAHGPPFIDRGHPRQRRQLHIIIGQRARGVLAIAF